MKFKKIISGLIFAFFLFILSFPTAYAELILPDLPETHVLDEAGVLSEEAKTELEYQLSNFETETSTQIVVVTLNDLQGYPIEEVALEIGREWGIGQEEFDNGIVFLLAPNERQVRIEVGRGLEGVMPDSKVFLVLNNVTLPYLKEDNYDQAILGSVYYILNIVHNEDFDLNELNAPKSEGMLEFISIFGIFLAWGALSIMSQTKSWWAGGIFGAVLGFIIVQSVLIAFIFAGIGLLIDYVLSTFLYKKINFKGGSGFGGFGGGSKGGGGFSGGGGSFGGGGASGRW